MIVIESISTFSMVASLHTSDKRSFGRSARPDLMAYATAADILWRIGGLEDWWIVGLEDWRIGGLVDRRIGGLEDVGGLVDWWIDGFSMIFIDFY